jgi:hypothetical protein
MGMNDKYILEGHTPKLVMDLMKWAQWFETAERHVAITKTPGGARISTVFLGLDHSFGEPGAPVLFETMVFDESPLADEQERYRTWEEAEKGHALMVKRCLEAEEKSCDGKK